MDSADGDIITTGSKEWLATMLLFRGNQNKSVHFCENFLVPAAHANETKLQRVREKFNLRSSVSYGFD